MATSVFQSVPGKARRANGRLIHACLAIWIATNAFGTEFSILVVRVHLCDFKNIPCRAYFTSIGVYADRTGWVTWLTNPSTLVIPFKTFITPYGSASCTIICTDNTCARSTFVWSRRTVDAIGRTRNVRYTFPWNQVISFWTGSACICGRIATLAYFRASLLARYWVCPSFGQNIPFKTLRTNISRARRASFCTA